MLILQTQHITVKTKFLVNNNGTLMFQRRVPLGLRKFFQDKQHIRYKLTGKHSSMAAEILKYAKQTDALFNELRSKSGIDRTEAEAQALLAYYGLRPGDGNLRTSIPNRYDDQPQLVDISEYFTYREDKDILTKADALAKTLLTMPMPLMLSKCLDVYFANHQKGTQSKFRSDTQKHFKHIFEVLGDIGVVNISRDDAKRYVVTRCQRVSTNSVAREISTIRAVLNTVIREGELKINNPFIELTIPNLGKDAKVRVPFTIDEEKLLIQSCSESPNDQKLILLLCVLTGARLSEVAGLRRQDVVLNTEIPHINFVEYKEHTLKTKNSQRAVPLVSLAYEALKIHLSGHAEDVVFPKYNNGTEVNGTNASSTIVGFIKRLGIVGKTVHHARHTMRDLLRHADVPPHIIDSIGGWGSNGVGDSYGRGYALNQKLDALNKALIPILD